jgi:hypothetical protein
VRTSGDGEGDRGGEAEVISREELADLLRSVDYPRPVRPTAEDFAKLPPLLPDASQDDRDRAFRRAQAEALMRIARAEKARREREGYAPAPEADEDDE